MRIAQIAPLAESVPPKLYGGTERVVAWLIDELVELGHDVTLFASGDSQTRAKLDAGMALRASASAGRAPTRSPCRRCCSKPWRGAPTEFDVIHCHIDWLHLPLLSRLGRALPHDLHGRLDIAGLPDVVRHFPDAPFVSISNNQRAAAARGQLAGHRLSRASVRLAAALASSPAPISPSSAG